MNPPRSTHRPPPSHLARPPCVAALLLALAVAGCASRAPVLAPEVSDPAVLARMTVPPPAASPPDAAVAVEAPAGDGPPPVFTLPDAVSFALRNSPRLRGARASVERAGGLGEAALAPFLPEAWLTTRAGGNSFTESPGAPGPVGAILPSGTGAREFVQAELQLYWTLYDFGRSAGRYGQAVSRERVARLQLERAKQTVAVEVAEAYLRVLLAEAARRVQEESARSALAVLQDARNRREGGVAELNDVLRAEVQLSETGEALVGAAQAEYDALARLNHSLGRNAALPLRLVDWRARPDFSRSLAECLQDAVAQRREVAVAREAVAGAAYGLEAAKAEFCPRVYVRAGLGHVDGENIVTGWQEGAGIHIDQPIFGGFRRLGEKRAAEADVEAAVAAAQSIFDDVTLEVSVSWRAVAATRERIRLSEPAVAQARENLRLLRVRYGNGNATPTDIVDAEAAATRSRQRYYAAVYDYLASLARLEYATGAPPGSFLTTPPGAHAAEGAVELLPPRPLRKGVGGKD